LPHNRLGARQEGDFGPERFVVDVAAVDDLLDLAGRVQRIGDRRGIAELRHEQVDSL
jgi:hypothetical protein